MKTNGSSHPGHDVCPFLFIFVQYNWYDVTYIFKCTIVIVIMTSHFYDDIMKSRFWKIQKYKVYKCFIIDYLYSEYKHCYSIDNDTKVQYQFVSHCNGSFFSQVKLKENTDRWHVTSSDNLCWWKLLDFVDRFFTLSPTSLSLNDEY